METENPSKKIASVLAIAGFVAVCTGWSASALSATTTEVDCDAMSRDLQSLEAPVDAYTVHYVDHVSIEAEPEPSTNLSALDIAEASAESSAPFLYLTPRVASVLRGIFDATSNARFEDGRQDASSSPIAESDAVTDVVELIDESDPAVPAEAMDLPLFQQQMFRIDI